jgi:nucleosome binding factor SPN SPT16 subunit
LLSLQTELLSFIKDGVTTRDAYQHALNFIKEKNPDLEKHFVKNVGFSVRSLKQFSFSICSCRSDWD